MIECVYTGSGSGTCMRWCRVGSSDGADLGTQYDGTELVVREHPIFEKALGFT